MERNDDFPNDQARRWAIAKIVQMGLFFTLDPELEITFPPKTPNTIKKQRRMLIDTQDYEARLRDYWDNGVNDTLEEAMEDITERIYNLHDNVLYVGRGQKRKMRRMLCGYNIVAAQVTEEQKEYRSSQTYLDRAIILARESRYADLHATALHRRQVSALDQGRFEAALLDYKATCNLKVIPPQLRGKILTAAGETKAHLARQQAEIDEALKLQNKAESMIGKDNLIDFGYLVSFDEERFLLDKGATYMASPVKKLRSPDKALKCLPQISTELDLSRWQAYRQAFNHIIQARIHIDQGLYPVATVLAEDALSLLERLNSKVHLNELAEICETLKQSPYGNSTDVAMLEIGIMRNLRPEMFN
ncbi:MAG TPA: hypothetical protein VEL31_12465 [Ktedonobacteraceae bacterium]|nr:hypothetical protein [Ktedonobacteraceae bacterium]